MRLKALLYIENMDLKRHLKGQEKLKLPKRALNTGRYLEKFFIDESRIEYVNNPWSNKQQERAAMCHRAVIPGAVSSMKICQTDGMG